MVSGQPGDNVCVQFTVTNFNDVAAFAFAVNFNSNILQYDAAIVSSGLPDLDPTQFVPPDPQNLDVIRVLWLSPGVTGNNLPDGTVFFELCFDIIGTPGQCSPLFVNTTGLTSSSVEFLDPAANEIPLSFEFGEICVKPPPNEAPEAFENSVCPASLGASDGSHSFFVYNGTAPYTVTDPLGNNTTLNNPGDLATFGNLATGIYTYTITDANGSTNYTVNVQEATAISTTLDIKNPTCFDDDNGRITLTVSGGDPYLVDGKNEYFFEWSSTQIGLGQNVIRNLANGSYDVTVSDAKGCRISQSFLVNTSPLSPTITFTGPLCEGANTGQIIVRGLGGSGLYTFILSGASNRFENDVSFNSFNNLPAGDYFIEVRDVIGGDNCLYTDSVSLAVTNELTMQFTRNSLDCGADVLDLDVEFANSNEAPSADYELLIIDLNSLQVYLDTVVTTATTNLPNLPISNYQFQGRSSDGCEIDTIIDLQNSGVLSLDSVAMLNPCVGEINGSIELFVSSASQVTYEWNTGATLQDLTDLFPGSYDVRISNVEGCQIIQQFTLDTVSMIISSASNAALSCTDTQGDITAVIEGGNAPYSFEWDHLNNTSEATLANVIPGLYFVTVTDVNGCTAQQGLRLNAADAVTLDTARTFAPSCHDLTDGAAEALAQGGSSNTGNYTYIWSNGIVEVTSIGSFVSQLPSGQNWVVADDGTCTSDTFFFNISEGRRYMVDTINSIITPPSCSGDDDGFLRVEVTPDISNTAFMFTFPDLNINNTTNPTLTNLGGGDIRVIITDSNGCSNEDVVAIAAANTLTARIDSVASELPVCADDILGSVVVNASGGTGQLTYTWSNNVSSTNVADNLPVGSYSVTVSDENFCEVPLSIDIIVPEGVTATVNSFDPLCFGNAGGITVSEVSGGSGMNYRFQVNTDPALAIVDTAAVAPGTYTVRVFDSEGCSFTSNQVLIPQVPELVVDLDVDRTIQLGSSSDIVARVITSTPIVDVLWDPLEDIEFLSNDNLDVSVSPASDRVYSITITDENGCTATDDVLIRVERSVSVYVPNVFNIDETSQNRRMKVFAGAAVVGIDYVRIYDRWGSLLQEVNNIPPNIFGVEVWDGTVNGQDLNSGVFVYVLGYTLVDGTTGLLTGDVTLLR